MQWLPTRFHYMGLMEPESREKSARMNRGEDHITKPNAALERIQHRGPSVPVRSYDPNKQGNRKISYDRRSLIMHRHHGRPGGRRTASVEQQSDKSRDIDVLIDHRCHGTSHARRMLRNRRRSVMPSTPSMLSIVLSEQYCTAKPC